MQVQASDGKWVSAPHIPGTFLVNLGDMTARWTNDTYKSTLHRVASPAPGSRARCSAVFFVNVNYDAEVAVIPGVGGEPKYQPIKAGEMHELGHTLDA